MRSLLERVVLCAAGLIVAGCEGMPSAPTPTATTSQSLGVISDIAGVVDRGLTGNYHYFELYASAANGFPANVPDHGYIAFAECNGESYASNASFAPTETCSAPQAIIQYQPPAPGGGQINVGILETNPCLQSAFDPFIAWPSSGTQCWFRLEYSQLGTRADASITHGVRAGRRGGRGSHQLDHHQRCHRSRDQQRAPVFHAVRELPGSQEQAGCGVQRPVRVAHHGVCADRHACRRLDPGPDRPDKLSVRGRRSAVRQ
jgi:hypothetical protein